MQEHNSGKPLRLDPTARSDSSDLPAFLARPKDAPVYHGFPVIEETRTQGWVLGAITEYDDPEGCNWGDAFVVAPDGSRAGIVWQVGTFDIHEITPPSAERWGVYGVAFPKPIRTTADLVECFREILPQLQGIHSLITNRGSSLALTADHAATIRAHGERAYPYECCGFLLGKSLWHVEVVVPATNSKGHEERHNRFVITPEASMRAEKEARQLGLSIIGHYHSHPDHPARPSQGFAESDLENATWPGYAFVIVSVNRRWNRLLTCLIKLTFVRCSLAKAAEITCWNLADDRSKFEPIPVKIT